MRKLIITVVVFSIVASLFSCAKFQHNFIMNGKWELVSAYNNNDYSINFLNVILPGFNAGGDCCHYIIDFQDQGKAFGFYYSNDTLVYEVQGTWDVPEKNHLYVDLDRYVNGDFLIDRTDHRKYKLTTDSNSANIFGAILINPLEMNIERLKK